MYGFATCWVRNSLIGQMLYILCGEMNSLVSDLCELFLITDKDKRPIKEEDLMRLAINHL